MAGLLGALVAVGAVAAPPTAAAQPHRPTDEFRLRVAKVMYLPPEGAQGIGLNAVVRADNGAEPRSRDVTLVFDASDLKGKAVVGYVSSDCAAEDMVVTCSGSSRAAPPGFALESVKGVRPGEAGVIRTTYRGSQDPELTTTTRVLIGWFVAATGVHEPYTLKRDAPRRAPALVPRFGNAAELTAPFGVRLRVEVKGAKFEGPGYSNCDYANKVQAVCDFPMAEGFRPGAAFETSGAFEATTDRSGQAIGSYTYSVVALDAQPHPGDDHFASGGLYGQGPALGLVPVDFGSLKGPHTGGVQKFISPDYRRADHRMPPIALRGMPGDVVEAPLRPVGKGSGGTPVILDIQLPQGVALDPGPANPDAHYCAYVYQSQTQITCGRGGTGVLRLRIADSVRPGQSLRPGAVHLAVPWGDPTPKDNTGAITLTIGEPLPQTGARWAAGAALAAVLAAGGVLSVRARRRRRSPEPTTRTDRRPDDPKEPA
ncbi:LPXTG cell wall anchor domain-containing protein [Streptomyces sp. NPDC101118]|uniref:LPXTG cell wall anchor domain-containing protein n=1 Tax=Streptomyces sp. NPDC101118 TaxID=3366109 RepID=UPI003807AEF3